MIEKRSTSLFPIIVLALTLAACSILYELLAAQTLSLLAANTVIWYSLVVGIFLASMGIGAFFTENSTSKSPWLPLLRIEILLTTLGVLTVPLVRTAHTIFSQLQFRSELELGLLAFYAVVIPIIVILGVLTGAELPLLMKLARQRIDETRSSNITLGWDYLGSLVGAMLFPLIILPAMNLIIAGLVIASINLAVAIWILLFQLDIKKHLIESTCVAFVLGMLLAGGVYSTQITEYFQQRYYFYPEMKGGLKEWLAPRDDLPPVKQVRSPYQIIDFTEDPSRDFLDRFLSAYSDKLKRQGDFPVDHVLFLNGARQTNTRNEEVYHEWFAHVPIILSQQVPKKILVLGGGDGFLLRELLKYPGVDQVTHVDIDPVLIEFSKQNEVLRRVNRNAFDDQRVQTIITDGYQFVRNSDETFDAVYIDLPVPNTYDLAKLYSREFYTFVRQRLNPDGYAVFDSFGTSYLEPRKSLLEPGVMLPTNSWPQYSNTLLAAGFKTILPYFSALEIKNLRITQMINSMGFRPTPDDMERLDAIKDPLERQMRYNEIMEDIHSSLQRAASTYFFQGFVFMTANETELNKKFYNPGVRMYVLNKLRFELSIQPILDVPEQVDPAKVNSILRPTLPVIPWWRPITSY